MRIAINTRFLLPIGLEGVGYFTQEVCRRLVERWPEHEFLFLFDRPFDEKYLYGPNVTGRVVFPPARHPLLWWWWFERALPPVLKAWKADLFFSPDGYCSLRSKVPTLMVCHDLAYLHYPQQVPPLVLRYYRYFVPRYLARAEALATVSEFSKQDMVQHYGLAPGKISVVYSGVKPEFKPVETNIQVATRQDFSDGQPYFFFIGAVHPRKNVARIIAAYDAFRREGGAAYKLLLGGRPAWQTADTQAAHQAARFKADIIFLGYVPAGELPRLLGSSHALLFPSLSEGFGVPPLEAMHCEVPVITSNVTSMPEIAGPAALLIDPTQTEELTAALHRISHEPVLVDELVAHGRLQRNKFSWDLTADLVANAIQQLAAKIPL